MDFITQKLLLQHYFRTAKIFHFIGVICLIFILLVFSEFVYFGLGITLSCAQALFLEVIRRA